MKNTVLLFSLSAFGLVGAGCYTVPETGRQAINAIPASTEMELGATQFRDVQTKEKVSTDPEQNARVKRVGGRIAQAVGGDMPSAQWEFIVLDAPDTVNAFALPGGKVAVYSGLLKLAKTDDELAIVMGHEIGHATAHHGGERMTQQLGIAAIGALGTAYLDQKDPKYRDAFALAYGVGTTAAVVLPHSRKQESEADHIGLNYAARAGYDSRAAIGFWQKMSDMSKSKGRGSSTIEKYMSDHPADDQRIADLQAEMPRALELYQGARH